MPRIRTVKPEHWSDKGLASITLQAHLLWIGIWNFSDDRGVFENDALLLKSQIFPRRIDVRTEQIVSWLDQLVKARYIIPFDYKGQGYFINRTFDTHQRIDKPHPSKIPDDILGTVLERSENDPRTVALYSKGEDSSVKDSKGEADEPPALPGRKKKFVKPSLEDLINYFTEINIDDFTAQAQAAKFLDYYAANGWKVGKNSMKDWHATARNWKNRMLEFKNDKNGSHFKSSDKPGTSEARIAVAKKW